MGKKIHDFFTVNLVWKAAALLMAVLLWFIAMSIENPVISKSITVYLDVRNTEVLRENNLVVLDLDELLERRVSVRVTGSQRVVNNLNAGNISAYIDVAPANFTYYGNIGKPLYSSIFVEFPEGAESGLSDYKTTPNSNVGVVIDYLEHQEEKVKVRLSQDAEDGYVTMDPVCEPSTVTISGGRSVLETIGEVRVEIDLENSSDDLVTTAVPVVYDINNQDITSKVELSAEEIQVTVPINKNDRIIINTPNIVGYVADGYTVKEVNLSQSFIEVIGKDEDLAKLTGISLPSMNVSGASRTVTRTDDITEILEAANVTLKEGASPYVEIEVVIEAEVSKTFSIPLERLTITGDTSIAEFEGMAAVRLRGQRDIINAIDESSLTGSVDISTLENGTHQAIVTVNLPEGVTQLENAVITVIIDDGSDAVDEEPISETGESEEGGGSDEPDEPLDEDPDL